MDDIESAFFNGSMTVGSVAGSTLTLDKLMELVKMHPPMPTLESQAERWKEMGYEVTEHGSPLNPWWEIKHLKSGKITYYPEAIANVS